MVQYLGIGRGARANTALPDSTLLRLPGDVDLAAFETEERRRLEAEIVWLSPDARRELIALIWLVQRPSLSFEAALRRTRRIPPAAQPGYLMGIRLERYIRRGAPQAWLRLRVTAKGVPRNRSNVIMLRQRARHAGQSNRH